jgi:hypothetical protein
MWDTGQGIAVDPSGNVYVTGLTQSANFPTTAGAFQTSQPGISNAFVATLNPSSSALDYSTYLGGNFGDVGLGIAVDSLGNAYVTGYTGSSNFPTTPGAFQTSLAGSNRNAFVARFENNPEAQVANLANTVKAVVSTGTLNPGSGQFLLAALDEALAALNAGRTTAAIRELNEFIGRVQLLVILRQLEPAEGRTLIDAANMIIEALSV